MRKVVVYTDGSCLGPFGAGSVASIGAGIVMVCDGFREEFAVPLGFGTSQQAELLAIYIALRMLEDRQELHVEVITDSQYACGILGESEWKPKKNLDIIRKTTRLIQQLGRFDINWVRGHSETEENRRADKLAAFACGRGSCPNIELSPAEGYGLPIMADCQSEPTRIPT